MTAEITLASPCLAAILDHLGLSPSARDRVGEIDRALAEELGSYGSTLDAELCASLVLEAADLIIRGEDARAVLNTLDWSGWDYENKPGDFDGFDIDFIDLRAGGDSDWGEGGIECSASPPLCFSAC